MDDRAAAVTFLLTDVEGSTRHWQHDPEAMRTALAHHDAVIDSVVKANGGRVVKSRGEGDSTFSVFDAPSAAVVAAMAVQQALAPESWPGDLRLRVRIAIHTGEAERRDHDFFGGTVNRCARLRAIANGGQTICSRATAELVGDRLPSELCLRDLGTHRLRDLDRPERIFQVCWTGAPEEFPPLRSGPRPNEVPVPSTPCIGRDREVADIAGLLAAERVVTLTGVGGVGKTRVAIAVAQQAQLRAPDGVVWMELASLHDGTAVAPAVADRIDVVVNPEGDTAATIADAIGGQSLLIVLDNCEHVRAGAAALTSTLRDRCPSVRVLATSRERLGIGGERVHTIPPLPADGLDAPAVQLLADRIGDPAVLVADDVNLVGLAQRLDGLPLALELAAARCRTLGVQEVVDHLGEALDLLADRTRPADRHQTMDAALTWSYRLLDDSERRVFERLSTFAAPFDLAAAERLAAPASADVVSSIVDKSLVVHTDRTFAVPEAARQYAARRLDASGDRLDAEAVHACLVLERVRVVTAGLKGPDEARWVDVLDSLWPEIRVAFRRGLDRDDVDVISQLAAHVPTVMLYWHPEGMPWIEEAVDRWGDRDGPHRHELLGAAGFVAFTLQQPDRAVELAERAMAADPAPGSAIESSPQMAALGAYYFAGRHEEVEAVVAQLSVAPGTSLYAASAANLSLAYTRSARGDLDGAFQAIALAEELAAATGSPSARSYAIGNHARYLAPLDRPQAVALYREAIDLAISVRNLWLVATYSEALADLSSTDDRPLGDILDGLVAMHQIGWATHAWSNAWTIPGRLVELGRLDEAALALGACEASGVAPPPELRLPPALEQLIADEKPDHLQNQRNLGSKLDLAELSRLLAPS